MGVDLSKTHTGQYMEIMMMMMMMMMMVMMMIIMCHKCLGRCREAKRVVGGEQMHV